jgi:hypothetical protein
MHTVGIFIIENMAIITIPSDEEREESPHGRWQGDSGAKGHRLTRTEASAQASRPLEISRNHFPPTGALPNLLKFPFCSLHKVKTLCNSWQISNTDSQ